MPSSRLPLALPALLVGSSGLSESTQEDRPKSTWVILPRTGAMASGISIDLDPADDAYEWSTAAGTVAQLWMRRESRSTTSTIMAHLQVGGIDTGWAVTILPGVELTAEVQPGFTVTAGQTLGVRVETGDSATRVSGMVKVYGSQGWLFYRLRPADVGNWFEVESVWHGAASSFDGIETVHHSVDGVTYTEVEAVFALST